MPGTQLATKIGKTPPFLSQADDGIEAQGSYSDMEHSVASEVKASVLAYQENINLSFKAYKCNAKYELLCLL